MLSCTFFGHRDCPAAIRPKLREVLVALIEHQGVAQFYVGRQGAFDALVRGVLDELAAEYPHIRYAVVLERLPGKQNEQHSGEESSHTMLPEGLETVHPRWAIARAMHGCWTRPTMWWPTSPIPGVGPLSLWQKPPGKRKKSSI